MYKVPEFDSIPICCRAFAFWSIKKSQDRQEESYYCVMFVFIFIFGVFFLMDFCYGSLSMTRFPNVSVLHPVFCQKMVR